MTLQAVGDEAAVVDRLDQLIGLMTLAFSEQIEAASLRLRDDAVAAAILENSSSWTLSGALQSSVAECAGVSKRTVRSKLTELRDLGAITSRGSGTATQYRVTGVVR